MNKLKYESNSKFADSPISTLALNGQLDLGESGLPQKQPSCCTLRLAFAILCCAKILVACIVVWYLGFESAQSSVANVADMMRTEVMEHVKSEVITFVYPNLRIVDTLQAMASVRFYNYLTEQDYNYNVTDVPGYLFDVDFAITQNPTLNFAGLAFNNTVAFAILRQNTSLGYLIVADNDVINGTIRVYLRNGSFPTDDPYASYFEPMESPESIRSRIEAVPGLIANNYNSLNTPYVERALQLNGSVGWTESFTLQSYAGPMVGIFATKAAYPIGSTNFSFVAFAALFMDTLNTRLSLMTQVRERGRIYVIEANGKVIASNDPNLQHFLSISGRINVFTSNYSFFTELSPYLMDVGLLLPNFTVTDEIPADYESRQVINEPIRISGTAYHIAACGIASFDLPWIVVVYTADDDWLGDFEENLLITGLWTVGVLILSVILTFFTVAMVTKPIVRIVDFMGRVSRVQAHELTQQKSELSSLVHEWEKYVEDKLEPSQSSSRNSSEALATSLNYRKSQVSLAEKCKALNITESTSTEAQIKPLPFFSKERWHGYYANCLAYISYRISEVQAMQSTFGSMLVAMKTRHEEIDREREVRKTFIRYIFHEVRVPFNAIVLGVEQLEESTDLEDKSPDAYEVVHLLHDQCKIVARILNDTLSLQKIEDGALRLEFQAFGVSRMVKTTTKLFSQLFDEKNITLTIACDSLNDYLREEFVNSKLPYSARKSPTALTRTATATGSQQALIRSSEETVIARSNTISPLTEFAVLSDREKNHHQPNNSPSIRSHPKLVPNVLGDRFRLRQVFSNFLSNATKFTTEGGSVRVELKYRAPTPEEAARVEILNDEQLQSLGCTSYHESSAALVVVTILVSDSGVGLSETDQIKLFQPYMQVRAGELQKGNGTGLGLTISKNLIQLHGGTIGCESEPGKGATFFFSVPLQLVMTTALSPTDPRARAVSASASSDPDMPDEYELQLQANALSKFDCDLPLDGELVRHPSPGRSSNDNKRHLARSATAPFSKNAATSAPLSEDISLSPLYTRQSLPTPSESDGHDDLYRLTTKPIFLQDTEETSIYRMHSIPALRYEAMKESARQLSVSRQDHERTNARLTIIPSGTSVNDIPITVKPDLYNVDDSKDNSEVTSAPPSYPHGNSANSFPSNPPTPPPNLAASPSVRSRSMPSYGNILPQLNLYKSDSNLPPLPPNSVSVQIAEIGDSVSNSNTISTVPPHESTASKPVLPNPTPSPPKPRILVVEDSLPNRKLLMMLLKRMGCESEGAENGLLAVQLFEKFAESINFVPNGTNLWPSYPFEMLLVDGNMPVMNGIECTTRLREMGVTLPIIACTGNALLDDQLTFLASSVNEVITKPIERSKLDATLKRFLNTFV